MKIRYFFIPICLGLVTPPLVEFLVQVLAGGISPFNALTRIYNNHLEVGHYFFMLLAFIPFGVLSLVLSIMNLWTLPERLYAMLWGGLLPIFGITALGHFVVWYPLYAPDLHASSTAVLMFIFLPIYCLLSLPFGLLAGWAVSKAGGALKNQDGTPAGQENLNENPDA